MSHRLHSVSGWVLAGGESRRMGRRKEWLVLAGETMLARQVRLLGAVARTVEVLGPPEGPAEAGIRVIPDERPGLGPLGGIVTALVHTRTEYNLFVGCDLPFLEVRFLRYLSAQALASEADATVPESPRHQLHPACAVYRRRALKAARASLELGSLRVRSFFPRIGVRVLRWPEIARAGFGAAIFDNINTPEDYRLAQLRLDSQKQEGWRHERRS
jgi:molybdenum cofactor guanylyltransferase